ncbi:MAG: hypothetical protein IKO97_04425, partial [Erysipelotrichaceae bacterium]|nr:hypothetical protein [Erysipelotrichaceae bacterium]
IGEAADIHVPAGNTVQPAVCVSIWQNLKISVKKLKCLVSSIKSDLIVAFVINSLVQAGEFFMMKVQVANIAIIKI